MGPEAYSSEGDRAALVFSASVRRTFAFLKDTQALDELLAKSIPLADERGWLVPVTALHADDERLIALLAEWRAANEHAFPTRFRVTSAGTAVWLRKQVLANPDRLLLTVTDRHGTPLGHVGLLLPADGARSLEIDNVVRGVPYVEPGIMTDALHALIAWCHETLWPDALSLKVLASNDHAVSFYDGLGFREAGREALAWVSDGGSEEAARLVPLDDAGRTDADDAYVTMAYGAQADMPPADMILTSGPSLSGREISYALDAARRGWNRNWSGYLDRFEEGIADFLGVDHVLATSSCTGALHIALAACGVGPGDEVVVPDVTWVATANAVRYVGATPVFADVQPDTLCLDPDSLRTHITARTKAVIPVHLYGHPADMQTILSIARGAGLYVIEDAAPAFGAQCRDVTVGTFGDIAAFSFQGAKLLVSGEGGALITSNEGLYRCARKIWDQGRDPEKAFWIDADGLKYKMANIQAAIGLGQVERVEEHVEAKRRLHSWYRDELVGVPGISLCEEAPWARSVFWMNTILLDEASAQRRDELRAWLLKRKVDTRPVFPAISEYPIWSTPHIGGDVARSVSSRGLNLPSGLWMQRGHVEYVAQQIRAFCERSALRNR